MVASLARVRYQKSDEPKDQTDPLPREFKLAVVRNSQLWFEAKTIFGRSAKVMSGSQSPGHGLS